MAKYLRHEVISTFYETGLVPLFYSTDAEICKKVVKACYDGGARIFEFTNRGDFAHEIFGELNKYALKELPGMILGVGSIVDAPTASLYIQLGANFIVSPLLNPDIASVCNRRKIAWLPGCASLSEINKAEELGVEIAKIFPGSTIGGPDFVKNILAPCPWTSIMPSGGVEPTEESISAWFKAGVKAVGMGSKLVSSDLIKAGDYTTITSNVEKSMSIIKKYL